MVDTYGRWTEEKDYSTYPEEKWCDYDRMAMWIREQKYEPVTSMENLIDMIFSFYYDSKEGTDKVSIEDCQYFVEASGGLRDFDWEA